MPQTYQVQSDPVPKEKGLHWGFVVTMSCVTIVYNLLGGCIFQALEEKPEKERFKKAMAEFDLFLQNVSSCVSRDRMIVMLEQLRKSYFQDVEIQDNQPVTHDHWTFFESAFYATTIITSVGYGKQVPRTVAGQWVTVCYAIIGIPLYLVTMAAIASKMMTVTSRLQKTPCYRRNRLCSKAVLTTFYLLLGCLLFLLLPALVFHEIQTDWDYSDALYFCFITITTIGLGDFVPSNQGKWTAPYLVLCCVYIYLGLAWLSGIITAAASWWAVRYKKAYEEVLKRMETQLNEIRQQPNSRPSNDVVTVTSNQIAPMPS